MPQLMKKSPSRVANTKQISTEKLYAMDEGDQYGLEDASLKVFLEPFKELRRVLMLRRKPSKTSLAYIRNFMRPLGILPQVWKGESKLYLLIFTFLMVMMLLFALSITCDLYEASQDILRMGEDLVVLIGIYLVILKLLLSAYYAKDIERIICEFGKMNKYFSQLPRSPGLKKIHRLQRLFFMFEISLLFFFLNLTIVFTAIMCVSPVLSQSGLTPYRAKFPFALKSFTENPYLFTSMYVFQSLMTFFTLISIVLIDSVGCSIFTQTTLNLKIFCIRLREMGSMRYENRLEELHKAIQFHQYLISLIEKINQVYYYNYAGQMAASTLMICLTAFETIMAQDQPLLAIKFQIYMFSAFAQLFNWCATGNMVYYNSLDIADAAYEIDLWYEQSAEFGYCLSFLIKRAQTPLIFRPKPFFCFNFDSFVSILSTSYSYFALLRTMND